MAKINPPLPKILGKEDVQNWLLNFKEGIRNQNYESAKSLFHRNVVAFESDPDVRLDSLDDLGQAWEVRWPSMAGIEFLEVSARIIPAPGAFMVVVEWVVPAPIVGGHPRLGRSTFLLLDFDGKLLCVHSHSS